MKARSSGDDANGNDAHSSERANRGPADWVWWGLLAAFLAVMLLSVMGALLRGNHGIEPNRGPATEAKPGAVPTRDIDRSRAP